MPYPWVAFLVVFNTYEADLGLKGLAALATPFIRGRLDTMSDDAVAGLKSALDALE